MTPVGRLVVFVPYLRAFLQYGVSGSLRPYLRGRGLVLQELGVTRAASYPAIPFAVFHHSVVLFLLLLFATRKRHGRVDTCYAVREVRSIFSSEKWFF